jgi:hypothetical protein
MHSVPYVWTMLRLMNPAMCKEVFVELAHYGRSCMLAYLHVHGC